jgi:L-arabinonolactonase
MPFRVECAVQCADKLGECALWDERAQRVWWVDIRGPTLKNFEPARGKLAEHALPEVIGSFAFRVGGGLLAALKSGLFFFDMKSGALEPVARPEEQLSENRFNDGRCDRAGRFWAGTMSDAKREPLGSLYRLDTDRSCTRVREGVVVPNSIAWSPDSRTMYFADTHRKTIWAYDYDLASGAITKERVFVDASPGRPDGSCVDAEGCLWNAEYGGWRLVRYTPNGKVDRVIELPVQNPTCCCFGGADFDTLYVTSATQRLTPEELAKQPLAGSLFAVRPGVKGLPEARYAG